MASPLLDLRSARKQHLLVEFAGLTQACLQGIYLSLTPGDPAIWPGVLFVRKGPYASAILRLRISFPPKYPALPPLITFTTDIFHPLITPLTTYTYTTGSSSDETVSARDDERLPSGGFSLRSGFPHWFGRSRRRDEENTLSAGKTSGLETLTSGHDSSQTRTSTETRTRTISPAVSALSSLSSIVSESPRMPTISSGISSEENDFSIMDVLCYMRSTFEDSTVLDALPLEAAGNPGAWHAWRSHRARCGHVLDLPLQTISEVNRRSGTIGDEDTPAGYQRLPGGLSACEKRRPGEWSWDGVWEERVRRGIDQSNSEAVLYGNSGGNDELLRFVNMNNDMIATAKENMKRSMNVAAPT